MEHWGWEKKLRYGPDCERIQAVVLAQRCKNLSMDDCYDLWSDYSERVCAGWLGIQSDDEILEAYDSKHRQIRSSGFEEFLRREYLKDQDGRLQQAFDAGVEWARSN